jgi:hypothetical protein
LADADGEEWDQILRWSCRELKEAGSEPRTDADDALRLVAVG